MVKKTVQRDEKRVIIYYTFDDEPASSIRHSASSIQPESGSQPSALNSQFSPLNSKAGSEATYE